MEITTKDRSHNLFIALFFEIVIKNFLQIFKPAHIKLLSLKIACV